MINKTQLDLVVRILPLINNYLTGIGTL